MKTLPRQLPGCFGRHARKLRGYDIRRPVILMKKYAFVDVQNTETTAKKLLGFQIDWQKFYSFLKNEWGCEKVFLYIGVDEGDMETASLLQELEKQGCIVRGKTVFAYKNRDKDVEIICPHCQSKFIEHIDMGYNRKSNCDVDLTVDAMENAEADNEFSIFTGDGDFEFLVRTVNKKGVRVRIVSSPKKIKTGPRYFSSRFSTKLRKLIASNPKMISFIDMDNIRFKIQQ